MANSPWVATRDCIYAEAPSKRSRFRCWVIVQTDRAAYLILMAVLVLRLLAIMAICVMPFGMTAPASALPGGAVMKVDGHCGDTSAPDQHKKSVPQVHCVASCTALPAVPIAVSPPQRLAPELPQPQLASRLVGQQLEIATPPPKRS